VIGEEKLTLGLVLFVNLKLADGLVMINVHLEVIC
jgi:hypothetical protein